MLGKWTVEEFESLDDSKDMFSGLQLFLLNAVFKKGSTVEFINTEKLNIMMNSVNYKWIEQGRLQIGDDDGEDAPILFDVTINGDTMTFKNQVAIIKLVRQEKK